MDNTDTSSTDLKNKAQIFGNMDKGHFNNLLSGRIWRQFQLFLSFLKNLQINIPQMWNGRKHELF